MRMTLAVVVAVVQMSAAAVLAQPLAERVPADALIYVGWRGIESMGPGYDGSHLKAVLEAGAPGAIFEQFVPALVARLAQEDREAAHAAQFFADASRLMWRHPTAFYVGALDVGDGREPLPRVGFICQAGNAAGDMAAKLNQMIDEAGVPLPVHVQRYGDRLLVAVGETSQLQALADDPSAATSMARHAAFKGALAQVHRDPVAVVYLDVRRILAQAQGIMVEVNPMVAMYWPQVSQGLGLDGLQRAVWTAGFDGPNWDERLFVQAPAPRSGLMAMMASEPVTDEIFKVVPQSAAMAHVCRADLGDLITNLRATAAGIDPEYANMFDAARGQLTAMLGVDLESDLLKALGPQWAIYTDRTVAGTGTLGLVLVNPVRDGAAVDMALTRLGQVATMLVAQQLQEVEITIAIRKTRAAGMTISYLATPFLSPAWGVKDGNLYVGLYPQVVAAAAAHVSSGAPNLLTNPDFQAMRRRLGDVPANTVSFMDLPQTASAGYQTTLAMSRLYLGMADLLGVPSPPLLVPPLSELLPHISPGGSIAWTDDQGYHVHTISSFPGCELLNVPNNMAAAQAPMLVSIMLPALNAARRTARQMTSNTHVRGIHQGCIFYAQAHNGRFPSDIGILVLNDYIPVDYALSPWSKERAPRGFASWPDQKKRQWVNENTSYVLVPGLTADNDSEKIVLFAKIQDSGGKGISIVWNDNHVTFVRLPEAERLILAKTGKSLRQWSAMVAQPEAQPGRSAPPPAPR